MIYHRSKLYFNRYIQHSQAGFRANRSTADICFTHKAMVEITQQYKTKFYSVHLDLTKAFDTINRKILVQIFKDILPEDELRLNTWLLSNIELRISNKNKTTNYFTTNMGTPQGDISSPVYFNLYLAKAIYEIENHFHGQLNKKYNNLLGFADDYQIVHTDNQKLQYIYEITRIILNRYNLKVNDKTKFITYTREDNKDLENWRETIVLGTTLDDTIKVQKIIDQSKLTFNKYLKKWNAKKITFEQKIKYYKTLIISKLLYINLYIHSK